VPTHLRITPPAERDRKRKPHHADGSKELPGWAKVREPKNEPHVANKNMALGQWLSRASANSGPKIAPGIGTRKSSQ
jgi:hypothetical protein